MIGIGIGHVAADGDSCVIDKYCDARIITQFMRRVANASSRSRLRATTIR